MCLSATVETQTVVEEVKENNNIHGITVTLYIIRGVWPPLSLSEMAQPSKQWSHRDTEALIRWRMAHGYLFSGWRNTCRNGWELFIQVTKSNLDGDITSQRAKRKWENLKCKYKVKMNTLNGGGLFFQLKLFAHIAAQH